MREIRHINRTESLGRNNIVVAEQINWKKSIDIVYWESSDDIDTAEYPVVAIFRLKRTTKPLAERLAHLPNHLEIIASLRKNQKP